MNDSSGTALAVEAQATVLLSARTPVALITYFFVEIFVCSRCGFFIYLILFHRFIVYIKILYGVRIFHIPDVVQNNAFVICCKLLRECTIAECVVWYLYERTEILGLDCVLVLHCLQQLIKIS